MSVFYTENPKPDPNPKIPVFTKPEKLLPEGTRNPKNHNPSPYLSLVSTYITTFRNKIEIFFQAEDGIRDFCLSRGLGDVYKRQTQRDPNTKIPVFAKPNPTQTQNLTTLTYLKGKNVSFLY